ncbi:AbrB family transcriptional regulator [Qingshengfaniella alkalisoli]|uniref:Uncharacterized protein n=1 Tax=Qingshengfaniella alkalisoli TaxID=2599296 RepID=A0A5B8J058_9RHOB|nr:AbrB family transcriptional regulator [Qingshengfaniella alkalisoli]QDY71173.1 hypothetical protein FPZ52_15835 [Qingshengfaniella alkalisoli]
MSVARGFRQNSSKESATALTVGAAGAAVFAALGLPVPFLTGSAVAVTVAAIMGLSLSLPAGLANSCILFIGIGIGSSVTPDFLQYAMTWPLSFVVLAGTLVIGVFSCRYALVRLFGFDVNFS